MSKALFDTIREIAGRKLTQAEVDKINRHLAALSGQGTPRIPAKFESALFFEGVRKVTGDLTQVQVDSINAILKRMAGMPVQHVAYVMATGWHEARFEPQEEWGKGKGRPYAKPGKYGQSQHGRGLVQLTWDRNYEWADKRLGLNGALLKDFNLALRPDIAADVLVYGMLEAAFASNGKPLSHYGPKADGSFDYRRARQTVNVMDKADLIAGYAVKFEDALKKGEWS